jgi:hypothetical protein
MAVLSAAAFAQDESLAPTVADDPSIASVQAPGSTAEREALMAEFQSREVTNSAAGELDAYQACLREHTIDSDESSPIAACESIMAETGKLLPEEVRQDLAEDTAAAVGTSGSVPELVPPSTEPGVSEP